MRGWVLSSLLPGSVTPSSRLFPRPLTRRRGLERAPRSREVTNSDPLQIHKPRKFPASTFLYPPPHPSPSHLLPAPPRGRRSGTVRSTPGAGRSSAEKPVRSAGCGESDRTQDGGGGGGGVPFSQLPPPLPPPVPPLPLGFGRRAGPVSGSAAGCSGWAGARRAAGAAGPNARGSGKAEADAVARARGAGPGARSRVGRRGAGGSPRAARQPLLRRLPRRL